MYRPTIFIHQNVMGHLNRAPVRCGFRAPLAHHVIAGIERRGDANGGAFDDADPETDGVAGNHADSRADGFAYDRARMIRAGIAVIRVGATG